MDLDLPIQIALICDLMIATEKNNEEDIVYSKAYFARYYCIDLETFHKWIRLFCPEIWSSDYKKKRKFTKAEADHILGQLGRVSFKKIPPQDRNELMQEIYRDKSWKKSRCYEELALELENRFPNESLKLNKIPPKLTFQIMKEELEGYDDTIPYKHDEFFRSRVHILQSVLTKYQQLRDQKAEVYRRYIRRFLSKEE